MKVLIAEDESVTRLVLKMTLESWGYEVVEACDGSAAWTVLQEANAPRLAVLDLAMPLMNGIEVCRRARSAGASVYIIMLTANNSKSDMVAGLEAGADDYVTKPFDREELRARVDVGVRVIELQRSLAERVEELERVLGELRQAQETLRTLSLTDDLTGLYNRRGFFTLAEQHLKAARRDRKEAALIYADMDGLKGINDTHGHEEGSSALQKLADILRGTFRSSDIIARIGGDEFVIFVTHDAPQHAAASVARLKENLLRHNTDNALPYKLSLSVGIVQSKSDDDSSVEALLARGDELMYREKRDKRRAS